MKRQLARPEQLHAVLRARDSAEFDLHRAFAVVAELAATLVDQDSITS